MNYFPFGERFSSMNSILGEKMFFFLFFRYSQFIGSKLLGCDDFSHFIGKFLLNESISIEFFPHSNTRFNRTISSFPRAYLFNRIECLFTRIEYLCMHGLLLSRRFPLLFYSCLDNFCMLSYFGALR